MLMTRYLTGQELTRLDLIKDTVSRGIDLPYQFYSVVIITVTVVKNVRFTHIKTITI
jgi:hypothetical protein